MHCTAKEVAILTIFRIFKEPWCWKHTTHIFTAITKSITCCYYCGVSWSDGQCAGFFQDQNNNKKNFLECNRNHEHDVCSACVSGVFLVLSHSVQVFSLMWLLFVLAGADLQNGHVLWPDGEPPAQRLQTDAVRQPADALCRSLLVHLPQLAALPL